MAVQPRSLWRLVCWVGSISIRDERGGAGAGPGARAFEPPSPRGGSCSCNRRQDANDGARISRAGRHRALQGQAGQTRLDRLLQGGGRGAGRGRGLSRLFADLKPADKIAGLKALKAQGRKVLMVGDGLNDAPALAAADASMSPISATHLTQAQADSVFLGDRLGSVVEALALARKAKRRMIENLGLAAIYNAVAVPLALAGLATPLVAAVAMSGSSVLVTLNALRARSV
jgi:haloacid dehalogenase-like hydrolase